MVGYIGAMSEGPKRLQFNLKTLLLSASFIGAGIGCFFAGFIGLTSYEEVWWRRICQFVQVLAAGPMIGAGLFVPFRIGRLGAYVGFFTPIALVIVYYFLANGWREAWIVASQSEDRLVMMPVILLTGFAILLAIYSALRRTFNGRLKRPIPEDTPLD